MANETQAPVLKPATAPSAPQTGTETVTIACKMPNGVILHVDEMVVKQEGVFGGGTREITIAQRSPRTFNVAGCAIDRAALAASTDIDRQIIGGFALSYGCPRDLWERWSEQHKDDPIVRNGLIFAVASERSARAEAKQRADVESGMEPYNPGWSTEVKRRRLGIMRGPVPAPEAVETADA